MKETIVGLGIALLVGWVLGQFAVGLMTFYQSGAMHLFGI